VFQQAFNNLCPFFQGTKVKLPLYFFSISQKRKIDEKITYYRTGKGLYKKQTAGQSG
jgi:hypothetical protein